MAVHQIFAENLRREVMRFRTIAEVCEGIGINRQQFNKYLAGSAIPSALTLRKICGFLEIPEQTLFISEDRQANQLVTPVYGSRAFNNGPFGFLAEASKHFDFEVDQLAEGIYYCYFPMHNVPGMVVRSLIKVNKLGNRTSFVRLTRIPFANRSAVSLARGRHSGTVFSSNSEIYFLGVNRHPPYQLSLMTLDKITGKDQNIFTGVISTRSGNSLIGVRTCIFAIGANESLRQAITSLGFLQASDNSVDPIVLSELMIIK